MQGTTPKLKRNSMFVARRSFVRSVFNHNFHESPTRVQIATTGQRVHGPGILLEHVNSEGYHDSLGKVSWLKSLQMSPYAGADCPN